MSQKPRCEFTRSQVADDSVRYAIVGDLVADRREMFKQHVRTDLAAGVRAFVFDFARCFYVDSSGLGALVTVSKRIHEAGGTLVLEQLNEDLRVLLQLTKLDTLFQIRDRAPDPACGEGATGHIGEARDV